ncbi:MAG: methionine--tRNA ligase subunit beta, partial [Pseudomonadales bacterium]
TYLNHLSADYLRYYYAAKLTAAVDDIDLNLEDFQQRVNSDLVGKVVNIASRCAGFIGKRFGGQLSPECSEPELMRHFIASGEDVAELYEAREFSKAVRQIMQLADQANQYIDAHKPWELAKQEDQQQTVHEVCSVGINLFRYLITYLQPILPATAEKAEAFLNLPLRWPVQGDILLAHKVNKFKPLITRIEEAQITAMVEESKEADSKKAVIAKTESKTEAESSNEITIDDFLKIDLRVARVTAASDVEGADKLLQLTLDVGDHTRTVFSGIKSAYQAAELVGKFVVVVTNLKPRKMRFGVSEGMVLAAAGEGEEEVWLVEPDGSKATEPGARIGMRVS